MQKELSWVEDFSMVRSKEIEEIILKLGNAESFVERTNQHFVAGAKGLGKTLLLIDKRRDIQKQHTVEGKRESYLSVHFIPESEPFLDVMVGERNVTKAEKQFFSELNRSKKVWSFALKLSLFSYRRPNFIEGLDNMKELQSSIRQITGGRPMNPTDVFRSLFAFFDISNIHMLIDKVDPILERDLSLIRDANYIFIDAVDQSISQFSQDAWIYFQAGLIEAAYDLMRSNQHVKVYASIRIEAFANYTSPTKANVSGYTTKLFYDNSELYDILNHLAGFYESSSTIDAFFGHKVISKKRLGIHEKPFNYLIRHTLNTPRELVHICRGLSESSESRIDETVFRHIVNERSANHLPNIFQELRPILKTLIKDEIIRDFLSLLTKNIIDREEYVAITKRHNGYDPDVLIEIEDLENPFIDLYNCGLLGCIEPSLDKSIQRFHIPSNPSIKYKLSLPESPFYFIHPSLQGMIKNQNPQYKVVPSIVIGQNYPWYEWDPYLMQLDGLVANFDEQISRKIMIAIATALACINQPTLIKTASDNVTESLTQIVASDSLESEVALSMEYLIQRFIQTFQQHHD
jgi:hypothetical protein